MKLTAEDWQQVKAIFNQVIESPAAEMAEAMERLCASRPELQATVQQMVDTHLASVNQTITPNQSAAESLLDSTALKPGAHFGKYQIISTLGSGGMGQVYLAQRDDEVIQQVAIKVLSHQTMDDQSQARFDTERRILASLEHPNIARLIDAGSQHGRAYYVMEYIDGIAVDEYCQKNQLGLPERLDLFKQICEAVAFAHSNLIVHRDLKPGNILVTKQGEVKLLDFGIAKPLKTLPGTDQVHQTLVGTTTLTPQYAAPEQIKGEAITVLCDVYVLGLLLYRLLTNQHAFELQGKTWGQIEQLINHQLPTLPSKLLRKTVQQHTTDDKIHWCHKLKGDLDAIVAHALKKNPQERYLSVREMAADISRYLKHEPLGIKQSQTAYRLKKQLRKHWLPVSALSSVFMVLATASVLVWQQSKTIAQERDKAITEKQVAEEVTDFLVETFKSADPTQTLGTKITAGDILRQGVNQLALQDSDLTVKNRLLSTLAEVYLNLSAVDEAESLINQLDYSVGINQAEHVKTTYLKAQIFSDKGLWPEALKTLNGINVSELKKDEFYFKIMNLKASLKRSTDQFDQAAALAKQLVDEAETAFGKKTLRYAIQLRKYATRLSNVEDYQPTITSYREVISIIEGLNDKSNILELLESKRILMVVLAQNLEYDEALALSFELQQTYAEIFAENHDVFASLYNSRGRIYSNTSRPEKAVENYIKSRNIWINNLGKDATKVAFAEINIGVTYLYDMSKFEQAEAYFRMALDKFLLNSGKNNNYYYMRIPYAFCLIKLERYEDAKSVASESLNYYLNRKKQSEININLAKSLMAHILIVEGEYEQAHKLLKGIVTNVMKHYGDTIHKDMIEADIAILENKLGVQYVYENIHEPDN